MENNNPTAKAIGNYFKKFSSRGIPFMDDREKGDIRTLNGELLHIDDFGFIRGRDGEYAVVSFKEHADKFYFAGMALTDMLHTVDADGMRDELKNMTIVLSGKRSKNGRDYQAFDFPEAE